MILVYVITVAILAAAAVFYKKMDSKFKQEIADQKAIVTALQKHVDVLSKKRDQLLKDLRNVSNGCYIFYTTLGFGCVYSPYSVLFDYNYNIW